MKGFKTIVFGLALGVLPQVLTYLAGLDLTQYGLSPNIATLIGAAICALRFATTGPVFVK